MRKHRSPVAGEDQVSGSKMASHPHVTKEGRGKRDQACSLQLLYKSTNISMKVFIVKNLPKRPYIFVNLNFYVYGCFTCMSVYHMSACYPWRTGVESHGTGVTDNCDLSGEFWELKLDPLQWQQVLLTRKPSL